MPAQSKQQQKLFGLALSVKRGDTPRSEVSDDVLGIVDKMSEKEIEDFASTDHKGLPTKKEEIEEIIRERIREMLNPIMKEGRAFVQAAKKAQQEGKTEFEFNGKTYPITLKEEVITEMSDKEFVGDQLIAAGEGSLSRNEFIKVVSKKTKLDKNMIGKVHDIYLKLDGRQRVKLDTPRNMDRFLDKLGITESINEINYIDKTDMKDSVLRSNKVATLIDLKLFRWAISNSVRFYKGIGQNYMFTDGIMSLGINLNKPYTIVKKWGKVDNKLKQKYIKDIRENIENGDTMEREIVNEGQLKKFDDVHIKSKNLSGMVYKISGNTVVVRTIDGLVKAKKNDVTKIHNDNVNEAMVKIEVDMFKQFNQRKPDKTMPMKIDSKTPLSKLLNHTTFKAMKQKYDYIELHYGDKFLGSAMAGTDNWEFKKGRGLKDTSFRESVNEGKLNEVSFEEIKALWVSYKVIVEWGIPLLIISTTLAALGVAYFVKLVRQGKNAFMAKYREIKGTVDKKEVKKAEELINKVKKKNESVNGSNNNNKIIKEETFTAINKDTGKVSVFKSKDSRDAAIKAGTHEKKDKKDSEDKNKSATSVSGKNMFKHASDIKKQSGDTGDGGGDGSKLIKKLSKVGDAIQKNNLQAKDIWRGDLEGWLDEEKTIEYFSTLNDNEKKEFVDTLDYVAKAATKLRDAEGQEYDNYSSILDSKDEVYNKLMDSAGENWDFQNDLEHVWKRYMQDPANSGIEKTLKRWNDFTQEYPEAKIFSDDELKSLFDSGKKIEKIYDKQEKLVQDISPSAYDAEKYLPRMVDKLKKELGESVNEGKITKTFKFPRKTSTDIDEIDADFSRHGIQSNPDFNNNTVTVTGDENKIKKIVKFHRGIEESVNENKINIDKKVTNIIKTRDFKEFVRYINSFYGKKGVYSSGKDVKEKDIMKALYKVFKRNNSYEWGYGDSVDRELVRDELMKMGILSNKMYEQEVNEANGEFVTFIEKDNGRKKLLRTSKSQRAANMFMRKHMDSILNKSGIRSIGTMSKDQWEKKEAQFAENIKKSDMKTVTKKEWDRTHKDFKGMIKGQPYMMWYDKQTHTTVYGPVHIKEDRQLKDPKKEMMVAKKGKVIVIDKKDWNKYKSKGYIVAENKQAEELWSQTIDMLDKNLSKGYDPSKIRNVNLIAGTLQKLFKGLPQRNAMDMATSYNDYKAGQKDKKQTVKDWVRILKKHQIKESVNENKNIKVTFRSKAAKKKYMKKQSLQPNSKEIVSQTDTSLTLTPDMKDYVSKKSHGDLIYQVESVVNEGKDPEIITQLRDVVKNGYKTLKDPKSGKRMKVDTYSASAIVGVYDKLNPSNQEKFVKQGLLGMQSLAFKFVK